MHNSFLIKLSKDISIIVSLVSFFYLWDVNNIYNFFDLRLLILFALPFYFKEFLKLNQFALVVFCFLFLHLISVNYFNELTISNKALLQIILITYIIIFAFIFKDKIFQILPLIVRIFMLSFTILTLFHLEHISLKPNNDPSSSCSFFLDTSLSNKGSIFSENSHFGMIATGTFLYFIFSIKKKNIVSELLVFYPCLIFLSFVYASTTYFVGFILSSLVIIIFLFERKYIINFIILFFTFTINSIFFFSMEECTTRITRANFTEYYNISKIMDKRKISCQNILSEIELKKLYGFANKGKFKLFNEEISNLCNLNFTDKEIKELQKYNLSINSKEKKFENPNITVEVYENAFVVTLNAIKDQFYGYGINNYKLAFEKFTPLNFRNSNILQESIRKNISPEILTLNKTDGRSNFFKLTTEFGIFSLLIYLFCVYFTLDRKIKLKQKSFIIPIIITQLISGAGYFNGGFVLCLAIMTSLSFQKKINNNDQ
jgi:hypothetical protein